jgi:hypothetical protein
MGGGGVATNAKPRCFNPREKAPLPVAEMLGRPQRRSGRIRKGGEKKPYHHRSSISGPCNPQRSLYRLRYPGQQCLHFSRSATAVTKNTAINSRFYKSRGTSSLSGELLAVQERTCFLHFLFTCRVSFFLLK